MTNSKQIKKGNNTVFAAVAGAVVGAGVAVAGAFAMKDKKNQDKVKKVFTDVKNQAVSYMGKIEKEVKKDKSIIDTKNTAVQTDIKKTVKDLKKDINKGKEKVKKIVKISKDTKEKIKKEL